MSSPSVHPAVEVPPPTTRTDGVGSAGQRALEMLADSAVNRWIFSRFEASVRGDVLEIGSGLGGISGLIRPRADSAMFTEVEARYLGGLRDRFAGDARVSLAIYDLEGPPPPEVAARQFDTIVAVNVLEHVRDDLGALRHLRSRLRPGGRLCLYVPACPVVFGSLDVALGHHRRYSAPSLASVLARASFVADPPRYINLLGLLGWFVNGRVIRRKFLPATQLALFDRLVPLLRRAEEGARLPVGLGLTTVARLSE